MRRILLVLTFLLAALSVTACSPSKGTDAPDAGPPDACGTGGNDGGVCLGPFVSCADLTTPNVSFAADIVPIFRPSCAIAGSTCHGTPDVAANQARPYLGSFDGGTDASFVVQGLVGVLSNENPTMLTVAAGDPVNSFLMHKLDGDQCSLQGGNACVTSATQYTDCGQQMPYSSPPLDDATKDIVRRWIQQGAQNN